MLGIPSVISQHWFGKWLGAISQQAITWTSVEKDSQRHMASLGYTELCATIDSQQATAEHNDHLPGY